MSKAVPHSSFRRGRPRVCASADCRKAFPPYRPSQIYCSDKCRNREGARRMRNFDVIQQHIVTMRHTLTELAALVSPREAAE